MVNVWVISAFCNAGQGGNKAGVVFDRPDLTVAQKMKIAEILGYSETAYVTASDAANYKVEYFTPVDEVPLCGHATIATFSALWKLNGEKAMDCSIETKAGILRIQVQDDGLVFMEQNPPMFFEKLDKDQLACCFDPEAFETGLPIQMVSTGLKDILLPIKNETALADLNPEFSAMSDLSAAQDAVGVHAFAIADREGVTAICRNFAPLYGIDEESATGTANCALAGYLFNYYKKQEEYVFLQGYNLGEVSKIVVRVDEGKDGQIEGIFAGGYGQIIEEKIINIAD